MSWQPHGLIAPLVAAGVAFVLTGMHAQEVPSPAPLRAIIEANGAFGVDLYKQVAQRSPDANLFFSPYSISTILGLVSSGARGNTAAQMHKVLHVSDPAMQDAGREQVMRRLIEPPPRAYALSIANSIWVSPILPVRPAFITQARQHYDAGVEAADFQRDPAGVRNRINGWVEEKTLNRITQIVPPDGIRPGTMMILANAVYFKDSWDSEFQPRQTKAETFRTASGRDVPVMLMDQTRSWRYLENDDVQVVSLPYKWSPGEMLVILPRRPEALGDLERRLTPALLDGWFTGLEPRNGRVLLPRFRITSSLPLVEPLRTLGMTDAFDQSLADFSGIAALTLSNRLWVERVFHKAFVDVDEKGTEAAAATVLGMGGGRGPQDVFVFRADHPFLFVIRAAGSILFLGRLADPSPSGG